MEQEWTVVKSERVCSQPMCEVGFMTHKSMKKHFDEAHASVPVEVTHAVWKKMEKRDREGWKELKYTFADGREILL